MSEILLYIIIGLHVKYPLFLSYFNETWIFSKYFRTISNFMKIRLVGTKLFHEDGRTDRRKLRSYLSLFTILGTHLIHISYMFFILPEDGFCNRNMLLMTNTHKIVYRIDLYLFYLRVPYYYHNKELFFSFHNGQGIFFLCEDRLNL